MKPIISATGIEGCNIISFDAVEFAKTVAKEAKELYDGGSDEGSIALAMAYLQSMNLTITMNDCTASFDNTSNKE